MPFRWAIRRAFISGKYQSWRQQRGSGSAVARLLPAILICTAAIFVDNVVSMEAAVENEGAAGIKAWNNTALDLLRGSLFVNYDKNSQPTNANGIPTPITVGMTMMYIDIDEANGKMTIHCWLAIEWDDSNRTWNPDLYDYITNIRLKPRDVWKPQITLYNSAGEGGDYLGDTQIVLKHNGHMLWVPPAVYTSYCSLNLELWPYDTQICKVNVGTWTLTKIDDDEKALTLDLHEMTQSTEWQIVDKNVEIHKKEYYNFIEYTFKLKRRASMYSAVIFTPATCIILLTLSAFWLPPQMSEKILLNGIVILIIAAFLMYFAQLLPILAENTPLIVLFYSTSLLLLSISTAIAVIVLYLATAKHKRRVPEVLKNLLHGPLGHVLLLTHFTVEAEPQSLINNDTKELGEHVYEQPDNNFQDDIVQSINVIDAEISSTRSIQFNWILLATAVDRIFFLIYALLFIVLAIVYSV